MRPIDLYSDTTTRPNAAMLSAMAHAEVGDEQRRADPTVLDLEARVAALLGKESAVFLPSATMANQIALKLHTDPGDEVLIEATSHPLHAEAGGPGLIAGVLFRTIPSRDGRFSADDLKEQIRPRATHYGVQRLVWVENTHNYGGGTVWTQPELEGVAHVARLHGLKLHLDGSRLLNAAVAQGVSASSLADPFDTVSFCLTKGLGAPVGGLIAGSADAMERARRLKQALGGAMRQAGILAAAGIYALDHHVERLADDHRRARLFARGAATIPGVVVHNEVATNIVFFTAAAGRYSPHALAELLAAKGLKVSVIALSSEARLRAVTHLDVDDDDIHRALEILRHTLEGADS